MAKKKPTSDTSAETSATDLNQAPQPTDGQADTPDLLDTDSIATDSFDPVAAADVWSDPTTKPLPDPPVPVGHPIDPAPAASPVQAVTPTVVAPADRAPRWSTIVWGLIVAAIGVLLIFGAFGFRFNMTFVLIGLLLGAGVLLIVGAITTALRRNRR